MIKAVFFDLDGVLIDSESMHQRFHEQFVRDTNCIVPAERFLRLIGGGRNINIWELVAEGYDIDPDELRDNLRAYKKHRVDAVDFGTLLFEEVPAVLDALHEKGISVACASSSPPEYIRRALNSCHITTKFDLVVSGNDFEKNKPEPDIYNYCLSHFGLSPDEALVVEDSTTGISAGKAAGIRVVARKDYKFGLDQSAADYEVDDLSGLIDIINHNAL